MSTDTLQARPGEQHSGRLLLPLLSPCQLLPPEIWTEIFRFVFSSDKGSRFVQSLLTVCKAFYEMALPVLCSQVYIARISSLARFHALLHSADHKCDSINTTPHSTPGQWVQALDLSDLAVAWGIQTRFVNTLLIELFPLLLSLSRLSVNPSLVLCPCAIMSLAEREGISYMRSLEGITFVPLRHSDSVSIEEEPLVQLLRRCNNLENLEVIGRGVDASETDFPVDGADELLPETFTPLNLSKLRTLTLVSMHASPLMASLQRTELPSLRKLTVTPYDDIPYPVSLVSRFIMTHGTSLRSLFLFTPKSWPITLRPSPHTLLHTSPNLLHLSLENPLPSLSVPLAHPLQILSIPRPNPDVWSTLEKLLPQLPSLRVVRTRDVRWLRKGITMRAQEAGVQGEMRRWRRRLIQKGIQVLDADWKENK